MDNGSGSNLPFADVTHRIIGVFYDVFRELGHGFSEPVYCRGLVVALRQANLTLDYEIPIDVSFRGYSFGSFRADIVVERVMVEVKASASIEGYAEAQLLNYLKAAGGGVGLLLNFGRRPEFKRLVMGDTSNSLPLLKR